MIGRKSLADRQSQKRTCRSRRKRGGSSRQKRAGGSVYQAATVFPASIWRPVITKPQRGLESALLLCRNTA
jgi:hypothetical protein